MPPAGPRPGWRRPSVRWRGTVSTWLSKYLCGPSFSGSPTDEHVLVAVVHHIAADGWSVTPLVADLGVAYAARCGGQAPDWAPLPVQYVDYTLWQREHLGELTDPDSVIAAQVALLGAGAGGVARAVGVADRSAVSAGGRLPRCQCGRGVARRVAAAGGAGGPGAQRDQFHGRAGRAGGAAVGLSASSDVAVGFATAGRGDPALDELVGFFVNTVVLRVDVGCDPTIADLLDQVRQRSLAAFEHQDVPFEVLVERLNPTRSLTHHPLVQVMLTWQNLPLAQWRSRGRIGAGRCAGHAAASGNPFCPYGSGVLVG